MSITKAFDIQVNDGNTTFETVRINNDDRDDVSAITTIKGSVFWQFNPSFTYFITEQEQ